MKSLLHGSADLLCGAVLALPFLYEFLWPLIFLVPAFWWFLLARRRRRHFLAALIFALGFYAVGLNWIIHVMTRFGGFSFLGSILSLLALSLYLSLFFALAVQAARWVGRERWLAVVPLTYYLSEVLRGRLFGGFPWNSLAQPLASQPILAAGASICGATGLSALLLSLTTVAVRRGAGRIAAIAPIIILTAAGHLMRPKMDAGAADPLRAVIVQPAIDEEARYHGAELNAWQLSRDLAAPFTMGGAGMILFPESVALQPIRSREDITTTCREWAAKGIDVLCNANEVDGDGRWYNSLILFNGLGGRSSYHKTHLVPFGEYLPLRSLFERLGFTTIARALSDFTPGKGPGVLVGRASYGASICYEITFSRLVREQVLAGAGILVSATNDSWYGRGGARRQHLHQAIFRSIEFHRPLVRSALTGISCITDAAGRPLGRIEPDRAGALMREVFPGRKNTVYYAVEPCLPYAALIALIMAAWVCKRGEIR